MGILGGIWDATLGALISPSSAGPAAVTQDDLVPLYTGLQYEARLIDDVFDEADGLNTTSVVVATDIGAQLRAIAQDNKFAVEHTYKTVLPGSLSWLRGDIVLHLVDPLRKRVTKLEQKSDDLKKRVAALERWRADYVDPQLKQWVGFKKYFDGWPTDVLQTVHGWLQHPSQFSDFAVPIVARPFVTYVAADERKDLRDDLTQIILTASVDRYRYAVAAFEAMLDQEWP